ncbi:MAG TPA: beta-propeller domain-containing protein [Acidimicrobiales bacterium]|nr:beta-propeller domain-containing protein [Acidimicrobiales bacterium]
MRKLVLPIALLLSTIGAGALLVAPDQGASPLGRVIDPGFEVLDLRGNGALTLASALEPFESCDDLLSQLKEQASDAGIGYSVDGVAFSADFAATAAQPASGARRDSAGVEAPPSPKAPSLSPQAGKDFSGTNVQEQGVDEPDLVKTDGEVLFTLTSGVLRAFDVRGDKPIKLSELRLEGAQELFISGDKALVIGSFFDRSQPKPIPSGEPGIGIFEPRPQQVQIIELDISDPKAIRQRASLRVDGSYTTARLIGDKARVVIQSSMPSRLPVAHVIDGKGGDDAWRKAQDKSAEIVEASGIGEWLPQYDYKRGGAEGSGPIAPCTKIQQPPQPAGLGTTSVVTVDLSEGLRPGTPTTIAGAAQIVYASSENLYVATNSFDGGQVGLDQPVAFTTAIHKLDLTGNGEARYVASGRVPGHILNQFSMSEHKGHLRVAVTEPQTRPNQVSESAVVALKQDGDALVPVGSVGGLGKGERIYAVRFFGEVGYVVTFRQTDPLYTLDLADPTKPAVLGELKIPGFSAYLHPIGDGLVIGIGQDATDEGQRKGAQMSIFDVSDLRDPKRLATAAITDGQGQSNVEQDHRAFLWWDQTRTVAVPFLSYDRRSGTPSAGVIGFEIGAVGAVGIRKIGTIRHPADQRFGAVSIQRSLVVDDSLLAVGAGGLMASDLDTFAERAWLPFCDVATNQVYDGPALDAPPDRPGC